ncbi:MAG TPA: SDR family oxidoreductase [Gemmatimonadaceae bacterium]|jgi:3-oxoacyl-[acyl-carrier protein] reductase|nr:SDR family oxidoreductase [Gemmatimonadaceae bacterium]
MDLGLKGRSAIVCAASSGLGYATAHELAAEGANVVICARGAERLERARRAIVAETGGKVHAVAADLATTTGIESVVEAARREFGQVDILVNNTGGPPSGPFENLPWELWQQQVDSLLRATVEMTRQVLPDMRKRQWGRVLNVTSITVKQPVDGLMLSNALRAGITGFARTLATEVARDGVTVNCILPGFTRTERVERLHAATAEREGVSVAEVGARTEAQIPMGRIGEPREFGALAAFLVSERASYITGQSVAADGGWIRGLY